jgi:hypothetical protein
MARDSSGTFYVFTAEGMSYSETPTTGPSYYVSALDCHDLVSDPFGNSYCPDSSRQGSQLAVGGPSGRRTVYVSALTSLFPNPSFRLGIRSGGNWTFEDLSLPGTLAADSAGSAWVSSGGKLYRRTGENRWRAVPIPCGVNAGSITFDESGALYVATGTNQIWRRDPTGVWGVETTPGSVERVYAGAGTVHYTGAGASASDGGSTGAVHYGRRVGTSWSQHGVFLVPADAGLYGYDMALDDCGAPHFAIETQLPNYYWQVHYDRWTAAGWRSKEVTLLLDPPEASIGVSTTNASVVYYGGNVNGADYPSIASARIPLR